MSDLALVYVRNFSPVRGRQYQVLEQLAEHTHHHDARCKRTCGRQGLAWPSVRRMAEILSCSHTAIHRALRALEADGHVEKKRTGRSSMYRVVMHEPQLPAAVDEAPEPVENPVENAVQGSPVPVGNAPSDVTKREIRSPETGDDLSGMRAGITRAREAPPPPGPEVPKDAGSASSAGGSPPRCPHHATPRDDCRACRALGVIARARARADARAATRSARAEREPGGYGPRGNRPGPQPVASALAGVVTGIDDPPRGEPPS